MHRKILYLLSFFLLASTGSQAEVLNVEGTISKVQIMSTQYTDYSTSGEAIVFIHMDELPASCGNTGGFKRVAITSEHPAFDAVVSSALAAKAAGQTVQMFYVDKCTLWNSNAWDFSIITIK